MRASCSSSWAWAKRYGSWSGLNEAQTSVQLEIATQFFEESRIHEGTRQWAKQWIRAGNLSDQKAGRINRVDEPFAVQKKSLMLTYNGDFGFFQSSLGEVPARKEADEAIRASSGLAMDLVHGNTHVLQCLVEVTKAIRDSPRFQVLRAQVEEHLNFLTEAWSIDHWAWSLELCPQTFLETGDIRLHLHMFIFRENGRIRTRNLRSWHFQNNIPHISNLNNVRAKAQSAWAGLFYIAATGKIGCVASAATAVAHKDFVVQPQWALNMMGIGKMAVAAAREHMVLQARDLPRLLASMDQYVREKRNMALQKHQTTVLQKLQATVRPFLTIPAVNSWVADHQVLRWRYKFLVLVGSSMLGKTRFALSLAPVGRSLELNCVTGNEPDLREYDATQVDLILLDEMPAWGTIRQKKLMQCPPGTRAAWSERHECILIQGLGASEDDRGLHEHVVRGAGGDGSWRS